MIFPPLRAVGVADLGAAVAFLVRPGATRVAPVLDGERTRSPPPLRQSERRSNCCSGRKLGG